VHETAGRTLVVTASIGLSATSNQYRYASHAELVRAADKALYDAKKAGRDRWFLATAVERQTSKIAG
jgi:diguanylate cyclase (GGDEF)-like protein